ncbi:MAG TPA: hypothetical protein ENO23_00920, partial [Alphaproteobacteria bacterium]|nr:hypothetical protein [Alphaproteobacteria bacterium]
MRYRLRDVRPDDAAAVNAAALAAFEEYRGHYDDWPAFAGRIGDMAALGQRGPVVIVPAVL